MWQLVQGPGFQAAIHPGAGKVFHGIMTGASHPVYVSDSIYINSSRRIFAISDPPGVTTISRRMLASMDDYLRDTSQTTLEQVINQVNREAGTGLRDRATLSIIQFPADEPGKALALLAGDSYLFQGNEQGEMLQPIEADANRWGTPNMGFKMRSIPWQQGDIFLLASDGIIAIRYTDPELDLEQVLMNRIDNDGEDFAFMLMEACNSVLTEETRNGPRVWLGGGDDISAILIIPDQLEFTDSGESLILGGHME